MIWWLVGVVAAGLLVLRVLLKPGMLVWTAAWWIGSWLILDYGFEVPIPGSVVQLFMGIVTLALLAYVTSDPRRLAEVRDPLFAFLTERRFLVPLVAVALAIPAAVAASIYLDMTSPPRAPSFGRTIHPAPPDSIQVHGETHGLTVLDNPFRGLETSDPEDYAARLAAGRVVYYENCFYCHGDLMKGEGMYAHAFNPIPTNFQDSGTIAQLQESFLFWRISKGGPGLPEEAAPWTSAMPAWESFIETEEMWNVILFLYDFTDQRPRARHAVQATATHEPE